MKRFLKITGVILGLVVLLVIGGFFLIVSQLPDLRQVGAALKGSSQSSQTAARTADPSPQETASHSVPTEKAPTEMTEEQNAKEEQALINKYFFDRFLTEQNTLEQIDVCDHLREAERASFQNPKEFGDALKEVATDSSKSNPNLEAFLAPIAYALNRPMMRSLLSDALEALEKGDENYFDKVVFYSKVTTAFADLMTQKPEIERVSQHSYHLMTLNKAILKNPRLADDKQTQDLCRQIQAQFTSEAVDIQAEKEALQDYLKYAGLSNEEVDYDPNLSMKIEMTNQGGGISMNSPWMNKVLGQSR